MVRGFVLTFCWFVLHNCLMVETAPGQSLIGLLGAFDQADLEGIDLPAPERLRSEDAVMTDLAKLVYRVNRISADVLRNRIEASDEPPVIGDAVAISGSIQIVTTVPVAAPLSDLLDLDMVSRVRLVTDESRIVDVVVKGLPSGAKPGDTIDLLGVLVRRSSEKLLASEDSDADPSAASTTIVVGGRAKWRPAQSEIPELDVLAQLGVDISRLPEIVSRNRLPLSADDASVFYPLIGASAKLARQPDALASLSKDITPTKPIVLLRSPKDFVLRWIQIKLETVRWTRVAIGSPSRRIEAGRNDYFQIDAIGDLGDVQLQLKTDEGDLVEMSSRYPFSLVSPTLPDFLRGTDGKDAVAGESVTPVMIEGFFYRLWSYESELMDAYETKQFAPLIIATSITNRSPGADPIGVRLIGRIAAIGITISILGIVVFHWITRRGDRAAKRRRHFQTGSLSSE
ncbi:MAG: hypothetical protein AAF539_06930 [Planctomycetota bacterium]